MKIYFKKFQILSTSAPVILCKMSGIYISDFFTKIGQKDYTDKLLNGLRLNHQH